MTEMQHFKQAEKSEQPLSGAALHRALEALLFVACEPLSVSDLAKLLAVQKDAIQEALDGLQREYAQRGFAGGYQFMTPEEFAPLVEKLYRPKYQQLSAAAMETLAIIAYKQPITRAEVSAIRAVDCDGVINTLLEKKLIREVGRVNSAGRAILYGTGEEFLSFFGIDSLDDLPELKDAQDAEDDFIL